MYRPSNSDTRIFNEHVGSVLELLKTENKLCYILGDYNVNKLNYDSHSETRNFVDLLFSYSLIPLINRPSRITKSTATLIDNVFTNNFVNIESSVQTIMVTDITDHFPIIHIDWKNEQAYSEATSVRRLYSHRKKLSFFLLNSLPLIGMKCTCKMTPKRLFPGFILLSESCIINISLSGKSPRNITIGNHGYQRD